MAERQNTAPSIEHNLALKAMQATCWWFLAGVIFLIMASQATGWLAASGICGLILVAAGATGGLLGFLFGVPRVLAKGELAPAAPARAASDTATPQPDAHRRSRLLNSNTNLEKISDWLTTLLVGVALSNLHEINTQLSALSDFLARIEKARCATGCDGGHSVIPFVGPIILIIGAASGFLFCYLYTRLIIVKLLNEIELELDGGDINAPLNDDHARAIRTFEAQAPDTGRNIARTAPPPGVVPSARDGINVMFRLLYKPGAYEDVISLGERLQDTAARNSAEYWFYLAAAYGQKLHALDRPGTAQDVLNATAESAFDCAARAVEIDPAFRDRIWTISFRSTSDKSTADDDLAVLRERWPDRFFALVRRPRQ